MNTSPDFGTFFPQRDIAALLRLGTSADVEDKLTQAINACDILATDLDEDLETLRDEGEDSESLYRNTGEAENSLNDTIDELDALTDSLKAVADMFKLYRALGENKLLAWSPPRNSMGEILLDDPLETPKIEPFSYQKHIILGPRETSARASNSVQTDLVFLFNGYPTDLPKNPSVREFAMHNMGEIRTFNKETLNNALETIRQLYLKHHEFIDEHDTNVLNVLTFFDRKEVKSLLSTASGMAMVASNN